jgi:hypothetical protein
MSLLFPTRVSLFAKKRKILKNNTSDCRLRVKKGPVHHKRQKLALICELEDMSKFQMETKKSIGQKV